jgi:murein DD-endopeptidase MepM/ murein hydrolase activator NlpD
MRKTSVLLASCLGALAGISTTSHPVAAHDVTTDTEAAVVADLAVCPLVGNSEFIDSWGDPRSSGRRHEGVDLVTPRGTPVMAVRDGHAEFKRSNRGGNAIWLTTAGGERFYYAHLDAWEGESREVMAGEVIGYVGRSGNARGDHLHFETRLGPTAVNPYPYVEAACLPAARQGSVPLAARLLRR